METVSFHKRQQFTRWFVILFYVLAAYKLLNGMWLFEIQPQFFNTRFDFFTWIFMQTGLHQWLLNNPFGWILFDTGFYAMPFIYWIIFKKNSRTASLVARGMLLINWIYVQCYTLYPSNSIEGHIGWLLFPVLFMSIRLKTFYFLLHGLRYFFLFILVSAALWKFYQGGIFNLQQMSGILLMQHKEFLVAFPDHWYTAWTYWLIRHNGFSYSLYLLATVVELTFIVGFFTRRYDRFLVFLFILFLLSDFFAMRIPYFEWLPLALPLLFSKYTEPTATPAEIRLGDF